MSSKFRVRAGEGSHAASHALSALLNQWFSNYGPSDVYVTCGNCKHMTEQGPAFCSLYNMTPPVSVIVAGCPSHEDKEEIPF